MGRVQIYETLAAIGIFVIAYKKPFGLAGNGLNFLLVVSLSSAARLFLEAFRGDSLIFAEGFRAAQVISLITLVVALNMIRIWGRAEETDIIRYEVPNT